MGRFRTAVWALLVIALFAANALSDGKIFLSDRDFGAPNIPFQRALIIYDEGDQTLILQSRYQMNIDQSIPDVGWVVPLPAVPTLASMDPDAANRVFASLGEEASPRVISYYSVISVFLFAVFLVSIGVWIYAVIWFKSPRANKLRSVSFITIVTCFFLLLTFGLGLPTALYLRLLEARLTMGAYESAGVYILSDETVGVYDVKVIKADTPADIIAWLNEHDFEFGDEDAAAFQYYIDRDWVFVVANISPDAELEDVIATRSQWHSMTAPLIMRFENSAPVYPLALTGTGGHNTEVILYTLTRHRMESNGRIEMQYAKSTKLDIIAKLREHVEPKGILDGLDLENLNYLCRFREDLTPEDMSEDIVLDRAVTNRPFGHLEFRWGRPVFPFYDLW